MNKMRLCLLFSLVLLTACSSPPILGGNEDKLTVDYIKQHIVVKKSTKADVESAFGKPNVHHVNSDGAEETWTYYVEQGRNLMGFATMLVPGGTGSVAATDAIQSGASKRTVDANTLNVVFNSQGIVTGWSR